MIKKIISKLRDFINDTYGLLIFVSWILLIVCLVIKIFGGNWFELSLDNEKFIAFCDYVDNTQWLKMTINCIVYLISGYFSLCVIFNQKFILDKKLFIIPIMITKSILSWYYYWIAFSIDLFILLVIPFIFKVRIKRIIICFILINAFQLLSMSIRNISFLNFNDNKFLIQILLQVDYYLMIWLFYLYNCKIKTRKEVSKWLQ